MDGRFAAVLAGAEAVEGPDVTVQVLVDVRLWIHNRHIGD